ncbi:hypothetical protein [Helicobacter trogontum]|uniref:Uncharacterized protein n=1 Tax=Helicobacter trogontum TaxID=50960 RepID=A0A4U8TGI4_9HELI|nr:hypothetical protein [Helicobacter trogontum]MDY5184508.1 hypothetical protein [Helicobacter trogontum]TLD99163.1 hypothetical protein LS80_001735 [Helicobacter trogontum]
MQDSKNDTTISHNNLTQEQDEVHLDTIDLNKAQKDSENIQTDSLHDIIVDDIQSGLGASYESDAHIHKEDTSPHSSITPISDSILVNEGIGVEINISNIDNEIPQNIKDIIIADSRDSILDTESAQNGLGSCAQREEIKESDNIYKGQSKSIDANLSHGANPPNKNSNAAESRISQKLNDSHISQESVQESYRDDIDKEDLFDSEVLQNSYSAAKSKKYRWQYLIYSKRAFIILVCIACFVGGYAMYLFFGSTSLEALWDLHKTRNALRIEVEQSRLDNATLQRDVLELRALEPK